MSGHAHPKPLSSIYSPLSFFGSNISLSLSILARKVAPTTMGIQLKVPTLYAERSQGSFEIIEEI
jgi:hypothetical protein